MPTDPQQLVYMDNHATTRVDPRVVEAMLPYFTERTATRAASATLWLEGQGGGRRGREHRSPRPSAPSRGDRLHQRRHREQQPGHPRRGRAAAPARAITSSASRPSTRPCSIRWSGSAAAVTRSRCSSRAARRARAPAGSIRSRWPTRSATTRCWSPSCWPTTRSA